jgi:hypothetical protein
LIGLYFEMRQFRIDEAEALRGVVPIVKSEVWRAVVKDIAAYDQQEPENDFTAILEDPVRKDIEKSLLEAQNGAINVDDEGDVVRITSQLMGKARVSIEATSFIDPKEWWNSSIGDNYLTDMRNTKKHVLQFTRVFVFSSSEEARLLEPVVRGQQDIGIDVRYACAAAIPAAMRRDFIVIDDSVAADLTLDDERHFQHATFYTTHEVAGEFDRNFHDLLYYASPYNPQKAPTCPRLSGEAPEKR